MKNCPELIDAMKAERETIRSAFTSMVSICDPEAKATLIHARGEIAKSMDSILFYALEKIGNELQEKGSNPFECPLSFEEATATLKKYRPLMKESHNKSNYLILYVDCVLRIADRYMTPLKCRNERNCNAGIAAMREIAITPFHEAK